MKEITFRNSPLKVLKMVIIIAVFIILGIWQLTEAPDFITWFCVCFTGLVMLVGMFHIFDRRVKIRVTRDGIWDKSTRQDMVKWEQIKNVSVAKSYFSYFIPLEVDNSFVFSGRLYPGSAWKNQSAGGGRITINLSRINCDPHRLAAFMEEMTKAAPDQREILIDNYREELKMK